MMKNLLPHECISTFIIITYAKQTHCKNVHCNSEHVLTLFSIAVCYPMVSTIKSQDSRAIQTQSKECT